MTRSVVFMYSGQGTQYYGMAREFFEQSHVFRDSMLQCDALLRPQLGTSLLDVLYRRPDQSGPFDRLRYSHPALFSVQYALTQLVLHWGVRPSLLLGYCMGELVAQTVAHSLSLKEGLTLVVKQAELVERQSPEAGMMAVLGPMTLAGQLCKVSERCWPAAYNSGRHFVITAEFDVLSQVQEKLLARDISSQVLPVRRGFHSGLLDGLESGFRGLSTHVRWRAGLWPVVSATSKRIAKFVDAEHCWRVVREPIQFRDTILEMERASAGHLYLDLGPSATLTTFLRHLLPSDSRSRTSSLLSRSGRDWARSVATREELMQWLDYA